MDGDIKENAENDLKIIPALLEAFKRHFSTVALTKEEKKAVGNRIIKRHSSNHGSENCK